MKKYNQVVVCGSIAFDRIMTFDGDLSDHLSSTSNISISLLCQNYTVAKGGTGANIATSLGLLEVPTSLVGAVGHDAQLYLQDLVALSVQVDQVKQSDKHTATFHGLVDDTGKQIGSFYPGAMSSPQPIKVSTKSLVIISAHDPEEMNKQVQTCQEKSVDYIYDPAQQVSVLALNEIELGLSKSMLAIFNTHELSILSSRFGLGLAEILKHTPQVIITHGDAGSTLHTGSEQTEIPVVKPTKVVDPTGAGDAFRAGLLAGLYSQWNLKDSAHLASTVASFAVEVSGGQNLSASKSDIMDRHNSFFEKGDKID